MPRLRALLLLLLLLPAMALTGCGTMVDLADPGQHMYDVANDEDATPAEIVEAGGPVRLAVSGRGSVLVSYLVESEDDEGPQATAWRLYAADGTRVAEGPGVRVFEASARPDLWSRPDGVLMDPATSGLGDLVRIADDGSVVPATPAERRVVRETRTGRTSVVGDREYRAVVAPSMDGSGLARLEVRPADRSGPWVRVDTTGIETDRWYGPSVSAVSPDTLLIGESGPDWFLGAEGSWWRVPAPEALPDRDFLQVWAADGRLFAAGRVPGDLWVSAADDPRDLGETWERWPR